MITSWVVLVVDSVVPQRQSLPKMRELSLLVVVLEVEDGAVPESSLLLLRKSLQHPLLGVHCGVILSESTVYNAANFVSLMHLLEQCPSPLDAANINQREWLVKADTTTR